MAGNRTISKRLRTLLMATALTATAGTVMAHAETVKITVMGVGDIYEFDADDGRGGVARVNAVARAEREANPNFLYVFDGDMLSPSLMSGLDQGQNMIDLTKIVPFDLAVPGNHEYDFGPENFAEKAASSGYPWAAINIKNADGSDIEGLGGVMMKELGGVKIALIPAGQDTSPVVASTGDLKFLDTVETTVAAAKKAREDGADIVIGVVQAPNSQDQQMIASNAFDLLISGDDHELTVFYDGVTAHIDTSVDGYYLVPVDLMVDVEEKDGKREVSWTPKFRFIDTADVTPDPETQTAVEALQSELDNEMNVVIGTSESVLDSRRNMVRTQETTMGNLIADAMREAVGADAALTNAGGIRADKEYAAGAEITRKDILSELPFGNVTTMVEVTGQQIKDALENGVSQIEDGAGRFPQVSNMKIVVDSKSEAGSRIKSVEIGGEALDPAKTYTLATNDYMLGGGDGYTALSSGKVMIDQGNAKLMANDVMAYIVKNKTISPQVEGRIIIE